MTTRDPNDLRDPRVEAAWRAASREEPPAALDDAIRAAARREIGAGPRRAGTRAGGVPEALRPERWWWPLAAAATIGAIAIGILQLTGPDHVAGPGSDKAVVSDMPAASEKLKQQPREQHAAPQSVPATPAAPVAQSPQSTAPPARPAPPASPGARDRLAATPPSGGAAGALRKDVPVPFPKDERMAANAAREETGAPSTATPAPAPAPPPAARLEAKSRADESAKPASPFAEPFPAEAVKRESKEAAARTDAPSSGTVAAPAAPSMESAASKALPGKQAGVPAVAGRTEAARDAQAGATVTQYAGTSPAPSRRQSEAAPAPAPAAGGAMADAASDARAKVAPKLPVPDWIALIRKLRDEGKTDEAAKELAAFRAAHADHERLLPPDLRDWKPAAR